MTIDDYQKLANVTDSGIKLERFQDPNVLTVLHSILGMITEVGELADNLKKHLFYGAPLTVGGKGGLFEEGGDVAWYVALLSKALESMGVGGTVMQDMLEANIAKLKARYGDKFSEHAALNRDLEAEGKVLG